MIVGGYLEGVQLVSEAFVDFRCEPTMFLYQRLQQLLLVTTRDVKDYKELRTKSITHWSNMVYLRDCLNENVLIVVSHLNAIKKSA